MQVALDDIDDSPGPFCMSFRFDLEPLIQSIRQVGLINPPILKSDPGGLTVVAGYRRIMALKTLNLDSVWCRMISALDDIPSLECLLLNLYDNLSIRSLNEVEKGMVLSRLAAWAPRNDILSCYMPLLGLPADEKYLRFFLEIERDFGKRVKGFIAEGRLAWQVIKILSEMDAGSRASFLNFISDIRFNNNQQSQFIEHVVDLTFIENKSIPQILGEEALNNLRSSTHMNRPQQAKAILDQLRMRRNPCFVSAEKGFKKMVSDLNLPDGIQIIAPPFFEKEHYRLEVLFKEGRDLKTSLDKLTQIKDLSELRQPWKKGPG
jgi:hypothetical protein